MLFSFLPTILASAISPTPVAGRGHLTAIAWPDMLGSAVAGAAQHRFCPTPSKAPSPLRSAGSPKKKRPGKCPASGVCSLIWLNQPIITRSRLGRMFAPGSGSVCTDCPRPHPATGHSPPARPATCPRMSPLMCHRHCELH